MSLPVRKGIDSRKKDVRFFYLRQTASDRLYGCWSVSLLDQRVALLGSEFVPMPAFTKERTCKIEISRLVPKQRKENNKNIISAALWWHKGAHYSFSYWIGMGLSIQEFPSSFISLLLSFNLKGLVRSWRKVSYPEIYVKRIIFGEWRLHPSQLNSSFLPMKGSCSMNGLTMSLQCLLESIASLFTH